MTYQIPIAEPAEITAGDYIQWQISLSDFPATQGWVLSYALVNSAGKIAITAVASGDAQLVTVAAATSASYAAGVYQWQSYITNGTQRYNISKGEIKINPNFAAATTLETRSQAKQVLDAVEAVILGQATNNQLKYSIAGRSLERMPMTDLLKLRDKYKAIYTSEQNAEKIRNGQKGNNRILVRL